MRKLLLLLQKFAFWGTFFLIASVAVFNVPIIEIVQDSLHANNPINLIAAYLLISVPIFVMLSILDLVQSTKVGLSLFETVATSLPSLVNTPYKGLDIRPLFLFKKHEYPRSAILLDAWIMIRRLLEMVIWWGLLGYSIWSVMLTPGCAASTLINQLEEKDLLIKCGVVLAAIIGLNTLSFILRMIYSRLHKKRFHIKDEGPKGTMGQKYFNKHPERKPSGCRSCGGPYPECRSSCNLYDD